MTSTLPLIQGDVLTYQQSDHPTHVLVNTSDWYAWLPTATTFRFQSFQGSFTARKERAGSRRGASTGRPTAGVKASCTVSIWVNQRN
jgi:hypothetical protein